MAEIETVSVNADELRIAFEFVSSGAPSEHNAYICLDTGRIYWDSASAGLDEDDLPDDLDTSDRYIAVPGQALAYKLGQLEILKLRETAKNELGTRYDIRAFHDEILNGGALPLDVLDARVTAWIAEQKSKPENVSIISILFANLLVGSEQLT